MFHFCTTNLLRTLWTKFYHNRLGFVDFISKNILVCFFGSQCIYSATQTQCHKQSLRYVVITHNLAVFSQLTYEVIYICHKFDYDNQCESKFIAVLAPGMQKNIH